MTNGADSRVTHRWAREELAALSQSDRRRERKIVTSLAGGWCKIGGDRLLNFGGNDYLGLSRHPQVLQAFAEAASAAIGATASALLTGRTPWHARLEERIAAFEQTPDALLFPSGYAANVGVLATLLSAGDVVYCDRFNHASLVDGCRLSRAKLEIYRHHQLDRLRARMQKNAGARRSVVITDGVFSMDGTIAPLRELSELAAEFGAVLVVDEAHGTGVVGAGGRGAVETCQVEDRVSLRIGTLSKAIGCLGGFVCGDADVIEWLWNAARTQFFSTALPAAVCAAAAAAFDVIDNEPERRVRLHESARFLRQRLGDAGVTALGDENVPIVPIMVGSETAGLRLTETIRADGFFIPCIRPPTVPAGTARLRISLTCEHSREQLADLATCVARAIRDSDEATT